MAKKDYYEILGVNKNATPQEIKKAYRKKALELHPDQHKGDKAIEEQFKKVTNAYDVLSNPEKRARYDRFGEAGSQSGQYSQSTMNDIEDILRNFGMNFGNSRRQEASYHKKGSNLQLDLTVSLQEIAQGAHRKIKIKRYTTCTSCTGNGAQRGTSIETCQTCNGTGIRNQASSGGFMQFFMNTACDVCQGYGKRIKQSCYDCHGQGRIKAEEIIDIPIPLGIRDGMAFAVRNKGNVPIRGGIPGDLHVIIKEQSSKHFYRDEQDNIHYHCYINFPDAALGTKIDVPTLSSPIRLTVPPYTQSETILRLEGKGIPNLESGKHADQLVHLHISVPRKLSKEEAIHIKKLKEYQSFQS